ncbi:MULTISPECIES: wax ester/triacylglycerol synthase domain-containing protein [Nocardiaceae]|uniref:diacylglycerol O-acyltransferase n=1 Tax=Rhodococcoides corynebacterioides TaxID=53972 RepID=A0ABS2KVU2_9NOCA|nr:MULTISPECIES: wax ester/triacylglycerol synthase domain-containing protein [Rhodococcus]MBM7416038.1 WS/DGAT/MGAT family acyltransferase [Rhodococcus corynebacterioides]MBP1114291.1 WS/DGAT/MGAT family acyltransferase [Rhodococcus sp. PvP016]
MTMARRGTAERGTAMHARDALNLFFESPLTSAAVVHCYVLADGAAVRSVADAAEFGRGILALDPLFTRRLVSVPADLAFPHWVPTRVDVTEHVYVHTPPAGRSRDLLVSMITDFTTTPLPRERPPWEFHFVLDVTGIDGVAEGATVVIFRSHHSAIDGMGSVELVNRVFGANPTPRVDTDTAVDVPGPVRAARALPRDIVTLTGAALRRRTAARALTASSDSGTAAHGSFPATRFNRRVRPSMVFDMTFFEMSRVRALKNRAGGVTLNDVMVTVVSLALSAYLAEDGELPTDSLGTTIPVSTRAMGESTNANRITIAKLSLHTDVIDPVVRLRAVHASASRAKDDATVIATRLPAHPLTVMPAPLMALLAKTMRSPAAPARVATNTMITNVPYGVGGVTIAGSPMVGVFGPLPTVTGVALAHAVATFGASMFVSVTSVEDVMPDTARYIRHIRTAFDRLEAAVTPSDARPPAARAAVTPTAITVSP